MADEVYGEPPSSEEVAAMVAVLSIAATRHIRNRARRTTMENAKLDPIKPKVRWVVEPDACDFCKRRGSFLFDPGEAPAESHSSCKCHPEADFSESVGAIARAFPVKSKARMAKSEGNVRPQVTNDGRAAFERKYAEMKAKYGDEVSGLMVTETRDIKPHEFRAYHVLMANDMNFTVRAVSAEARAAGKSSPDILLEGKIWELKCPDGKNPKKTVPRNIHKAIKQLKKADPPQTEFRVVVSALETSLSDEQVLYSVRKVVDDCEENLVEVMVIKKDGTIKRVKRSGSLMASLPGRRSTSAERSIAHKSIIGDRAVAGVRGSSVRTMGSHPVTIPGFEDSRLIDGAEADSVYAFAGHGSNPYKELRVAERLVQAYGGSKEGWTHYSGDCWMFDPVDGRIRKAEVHWMEHPGIKPQEFWWKRWRDQ